MFKDFIRYCEEGMKVCKNVVIKENFNKVVISGVGMNAIPGYIIKSYLRNNRVPVIVTEDYCDSGNINFRTLVILISQSGNEEEVLSHYRMALRNESKVVAFCDSGKLKLLYSSNKTVTSFKFKQDIDVDQFIGFCIFGSLYILRNAEVYSDLKNEIGNSFDLLKNGKISELGMHLAKRIEDKKPIIYTTRKLHAIAKIWKIIFNYNRRRLFHSLIPNCKHSDYYTYENRDDGFYSIFLKDDSDGRTTKDDIEYIKDNIKKYGQDVIEISLTGTYFLMRLVSAYLICMNCMKHLISEKQKKLEDYEER